MTDHSISADIVDAVAEAMWRVNKETSGLRFTELLREMARVAVETTERHRLSPDWKQDQAETSRLAGKEQ